MLSFIKALVTLFAGVVSYFKDKQLMSAGAAKETVKQVQEVERRVEEANKAVATPDPVRDERLRDRFDRSRSK